RATEIALEMVTRHGMDATVRQRVYAPAPQPFLQPAPQDRYINAAETTAREIDIAVRDIVSAAEARAEDMLRRRRADLEAGAALLLTHETVTAADFPAIGRPPEPGPASEPRPSPGVTPPVA